MNIPPLITLELKAWNGSLRSEIIKLRKLQFEDYGKLMNNSMGLEALVIIF